VAIVVSLHYDFAWPVIQNIIVLFHFLLLFPTAVIVGRNSDASFFCIVCVI